MKPNLETLALVATYPYLLMRAGLAARQLRRREGPGSEFAGFGRAIGAELLLRPVESVRYFEFPFALRCCPHAPRRCLDVASPRLFSLYLASRHPGTTIRVINPDTSDLATTARVARELHVQNLTFEARGVDAVAADEAQYDCIWALSVLEHIAGPYEDREAVRWMYDALAEGGRLILTVPVDRAFSEEFRDVDYYGTQPGANGRYFFQRLYDQAAIWARIVGSVGQEPTLVEWFGELAPGHFAAYECRWMRRGLFATVDDPRDIAEHYATFSSWEVMPGQGVCGLMFEKRTTAPDVAR